MILRRDGETGYYNRYLQGNSVFILQTHAPGECSGELCDVHGRRGSGGDATWPLNWRTDRGMMEVICEHDIGHPTRAQIAYWRKHLDEKSVWAYARHGCCGCCEDWSVKDV